MRDLSEKQSFASLYHKELNDCMNTREIFLKGNEIAWESVGEGLKRQILCYDSHLMMTRVVFEKGAIGSLHHHPHRQVTYVEEGSFEVEIDGEKEVLGSGDSFFVPPYKAHGVVALEKGALIDVFAPYRQEFVADRSREQI
ncbi:MAG: cupin domain-containing protein [bacterium]